MKSISNDIRALLVARLETSSPVEILRIASGLAANEQIEAISTGHAMRVTPKTSIARFTKLLANGTRWLDPQDGECVAVYDSKTNLTWMSRLVAGDARNWKDSLTAAAAVRLFGKDDWRAPTIEERLSINDYTKHSPALDADYFEPSEKSAWEWTSTPDASVPSGCAWFVNLSSGGAGRSGQGGHSQVRAVRAGQPLAFDL